MLFSLSDSLSLPFLREERDVVFSRRARGDDSKLGRRRRRQLPPYRLCYAYKNSLVYKDIIKLSFLSLSLFPTPLFKATNSGEEISGEERDILLWSVQHQRGRGGEISWRLWKTA